MQIIEVPIDDQILAQLDELVPVVSESEAVRELGITVTRETVARLAMVRGLKDSNLAPPPPGAPTEVRATSIASSKASTIFPMRFFVAGVLLVIIAVSFGLIPFLTRAVPALSSTNCPFLFNLTSATEPLYFNSGSSSISFCALRKSASFSFIVPLTPFKPINSKARVGTEYAAAAKAGDPVHS